MIRRMLLAGVALLLLLGVLRSFQSVVHHFAPVSALPRIRAAPDFTLLASDGRSLSLSELRGKVVVVSFIYTSCPDECPLLTANMATLQSRLGVAFGPRVVFLSITVDPARDTPTVLDAYARKFGANLSGWAFLRGDSDTTIQLARHYGLVAHPAANGSVEHSFLTSIVDQDGVLRVQYLGSTFDPDELLRDLQGLL